MNVYYSPSTNGFFPVEFRNLYVSSNSWPADATEITEDEYVQFSGESPSGKMLGSAGGKPSWVDRPELNSEQEIAVANDKKEKALNYATSKISPLQDAVDLGIQTEDEINLLKKWKEYRVLFNRVDTSTPDSIVWPEEP